MFTCRKDQEQAKKLRRFLIGGGMLFQHRDAAYLKLPSNAAPRCFGTANNLPLSHGTVRGYAQACPAPVRGGDIKIVSTTLPSNTVVSSVDNGNPVTRVAIAFKGGARYEPASEPGLSHVLRSAAGLTTQNASNFIILRQLAQLGASVTATVDRETITYTLQVIQSNLRDSVRLLNGVVCNQEFRPWELGDNSPRLKYDIVSLPPQVRAVDLLHKAAYRRGLGNSLFISPRRIGAISTESLQHFVSVNLTAARCAVTVVGDHQDRALAIAQSLDLGTGKSQDVASKYAGGELRKEMGGELAHVALALEGAKAGTPEALALAVAAKGLGAGPSVKWGNDNSPLAKAIGNVGPFAAAGFNLAYSDSGLFGVILSMPKDEACTAVKGVANVLKGGKLSAEAIKAGKNQLKVALLSEENDSTDLAEQIAVQSLVGGGVKTPREIAELVDKLSDADISKALSNAAKGKLSYGAAGNLITVPYIDEI